jgi:tRNA(Ile)-lysidine synthase TilS/MesJ
MIELDILSGEIEALMTEQRVAWRELASPTLTAFDRREIRNRIKQGEIELRDHLKVRTDRLRFQPRPVETPADNLANIEFRLF